MLVTEHSHEPTLGKCDAIPTTKEVWLFFDLVRDNREFMRGELLGVNSAGTEPIIYFMIMHACIDADGAPADVLSIAVHANCARTTAQRHLKELKTIGWVTDQQNGKRVCWFVTKLGKNAFNRTITAGIDRGRRIYSQLLQVNGELDDTSGTETSSRS